MARYQFANPDQTFREFGSPTTYTRHNLTDEAAARIIKNNPTQAGLFIDNGEQPTAVSSGLAHFLGKTATTPLEVVHGQILEHLAGELPKNLEEAKGLLEQLRTTRPAGQAADPVELATGTAEAPQAPAVQDATAEDAQRLADAAKDNPTGAPVLKVVKEVAPTNPAPAGEQKPQAKLPSPSELKGMNKDEVKAQYTLELAEEPDTEALHTNALIVQAIIKHREKQAE